MSHLFPLATSAEKALQESVPTARTEREAKDLSGGDCVLHGLVHDWIRFGQDDQSKMREQAEKGRDRGFVQSYEDANTAEIVYAVTYWQISEGRNDEARQKREASNFREPEMPKPRNLATPNPKPRRTKKRKPTQGDGRQLDLFSGPDQQGYERRDPNNPEIILALEEGDGTSFGQ